MHYLCNGGSNSFAKKRSSTQLNKYIDEISAGAKRAIRELFETIRYRAPRVVVFNCRVGQSRGPTAAGLFLTGLCRGIDPMNPLGLVMNDFLKSEQAGVLRAILWHLRVVWKKWSLSTLFHTFRRKKRHTR